MTINELRALKVGDLVEITADYAKKFDMEADVGEVVRIGDEVIIRWSDGFEGNFPMDDARWVEHISIVRYLTPEEIEKQKREDFQARVKKMRDDAWKRRLGGS